MLPGESEAWFLAVQLPACPQPWFRLMLCLMLSCIRLAFSVQLSTFSSVLYQQTTKPPFSQSLFVLDALLKQDCAPQLVQGAIYVSLLIDTLGRKITSSPQNLSSF